MAVRVLSSEHAGEAAQWDALVDAAPVPDVYYRPGYVRAAALAAGAPGVAILVEAGGARALVPLVLRSFEELAFARGEPGGDAITPYGYGGLLPLDDGDGGGGGAGGLATTGALAAILGELRAWLAAQGLVAAMLRLHPLLGQDAYPWREAGAEHRHHGPTTAIELASWNEAARCVATLRKGHRADVGAARKVLALRWGTSPEALAAFRALYEATMDRLGAGAAYRFPPAYYEALAAGLGDRLALALAYAGETPVAGSLFLADRDHAHYHLSATRPEQRVRGATALLVNEGAAWARARGCARLHLGGGTTGADPLYAFKRGFGGPEHRYGFVTLVADPPRYDELVARRAATAAAPPRPGFFPAYRG